jgi:hypothetical protein
LFEQLAPADVVQGSLGRLRRPAVVDRLQDRVFGPTDDLHRLRLHEIEEDEFVLWAGTRAAMNAHDRPWPEGAAPRIDIDEAGLHHYAQVLARAGRRHGRRHVGKSPQLGRFIPALRRLIPHLRVVQLVRDPIACVPSRLSLIRAAWRRRVPGFRDLAPHHVERLFQSSRAILLEPIGRADVVIRYRDLTADPAGVVERLHRDLDLEPWSPGDLAALAATDRTGPSPHAYELAEFGLDPSRLYRELAPFFGRFPDV